ncbi:efflux RND transporter periplasmic adaptor subunit [Pedobacter duraquae]|uniref:HlyD family secretion protein n=1 Tax=Pedobacter duraquae TaxID=425511 RepID=A0A4R6IPI7_9SPHI|nr:HlyD family efflux transporter periplasmic adaptor subunit [Pedobacter duraquae]TDO24200.1 HlyD family secretion protein [Pedobacter duraquae]
MMMHNFTKFLYAGLAVLEMLSACTSADPTAEPDAPAPTTPVTITTVRDSSLSNYVELPAVSAYLEQSFVKANINGYVQKTAARTGQQVQRNQLLFSLITKEARSIGNTINQLDPGFKFSGTSNIKAGQAGVIMQVNHQNGDYVQDGEALATISNRNSLVFLLDLPYALNQIIKSNKTLQVLLPDGTRLTGIISGTMPLVDSLAQTQRYIIQVNSKTEIPQGLIGRVRLTQQQHAQAQVLPKAAVLANETEDSFWVMKLINDSTAVKVLVKKGIESTGAIEVLEPRFSKTDRIISSGNYGLADTAKVKIQR